MYSEPQIVGLEPGPQSRPKSFRRRAVGGLLSAFVPGCGQLLLGQRLASGFFLTGFGLVIASYLLFRLPEHYWGLIALVWFNLSLSVLAACYALFGLARSAPRCSRWWMVACLPMSVGAVMLVSNLAVFAAGFHTYQVPSSAMQNTIFPGDGIMADLRYYRSGEPSRGDLILFRKDNYIAIKRVMGVPDHTIEGRNGVVYVDGIGLNELYARHQGGAPDELNNFGPVKVPAGKFFVIGDNRDVSYDSRMPEYGLVDRSAIIGKALYIYRPLTNRAQKPLQ
jgi:signal peptidase I